MSDTPIYVVVCASDGVKNDDGPIILETYTKGATLERAREQAASMEASTRWSYGPCRVGRVVFEDHPAFNEVRGLCGEGDCAYFGKARARSCDCRKVAA